MTSRIHLLSSLIANQIAAGEVIERPASAVKELLENSLDAGATRVEIDIEKGGRQLIRIRDNGEGIHSDDLMLAVSRHATSKIATLYDLANIQSLGFRGEALASIAAVSRLRIVSAIDENSAHQLEIAGDEMANGVNPASHPRGTTIEIRELFFNAPVRRRFLRTEKTEFTHIVDIVTKLCLSRNNLTVTLTHDHKRVLHLSAAEDNVARERRIAKICGRSFVEKSQYFSEEAQGLALQGWVSRINESHPNSNLQYFFLNGRIVRDKLLNHAIRVAAADFLLEGRHLAYVLYFTCDPLMVDVNVHPTKHEVRFQESRLIHDFIVHALHRVWQQKIGSFVYTDIPHISDKELLTIEETPAKYMPNKTHFEKFIGQLHQRYLLIEGKESLLIIDSIASREILFTRLLQAASAQQPLVSKNLLWPVSLDLIATQLSTLQKKSIDWLSFGIIWQAVSAQQIIIRRLPDILAKTDLKKLFTLLSVTTDAISTIAQFAAHSQSTDLSPEQIQQLLKELEFFSETELKNVQQIINLKVDVKVHDVIYERQN